MSLTLLLVLYFTCGACVAVITFRRAGQPRWRATLEAAVMVFVWPLWAPFSLMR